MRSIASNSISSSQAILVLLVDWWIHAVGEQWMLQELQTLSSTHFLNKNDFEIGKIVLADHPELIPSFWTFLDREPGTSHIARTLRAEIDAKTIDQELPAILQTELGRVVKGTGWFERHDREIRQTRKQLGAVRKVMES